MSLARRVRRDRGGGGRVRGVRLGDLPAPVRQWRRARTGVDTGGELGAPLVAHCQTTWHRDAGYYSVPWRGRWATEGGGPTTGHGIHQYDLLLHLAGEWEEVQAMAARLVHDTESEDVSTALVRFAGGALATVVNSVLSPDEVSRVRVDCADATVELTHLYGHTNDDWVYTPAPHVPQERAAAWREAGEDVPSSHTAQLGFVLDAWDAGVRPPGSGREARSTLEFAAALYKAAFTGRAVRPGRSVLAIPFTGPCTVGSGRPGAGWGGRDAAGGARARGRRGRERGGRRDSAVRVPARPGGVRVAQAVCASGADARGRW